MSKGVKYKRCVQLLKQKEDTIQSYILTLDEYRHSIQFLSAENERLKKALNQLKQAKA